MNNLQKASLLFCFLNCVDNLQILILKVNEKKEAKDKVFMFIRKIATLDSMFVLSLRPVFLHRISISICIWVLEIPTNYLISIYTFPNLFTSYILTILYSIVYLYVPYFITRTCQTLIHLKEWKTIGTYKIVKLTYSILLENG